MHLPKPLQLVTPSAVGPRNYNALLTAHIPSSTTPLRVIVAKAAPDNASYTHEVTLVGDIANDPDDALSNFRVWADVVVTRREPVARPVVLILQLVMGVAPRQYAREHAAMP